MKDLIQMAGMVLLAIAIAVSWRSQHAAERENAQDIARLSKRLDEHCEGAIAEWTRLRSFCSQIRSQMIAIQKANDLIPPTNPIAEREEKDREEEETNPDAKYRSHFYDGWFTLQESPFNAGSEELTSLVYDGYIAELTMLNKLLDELFLSTVRGIEVQIGRTLTEQEKDAIFEATEPERYDYFIIGQDAAFQRYKVTADEIAAGHGIGWKRQENGGWVSDAEIPDGYRGVTVGTSQGPLSVILPLDVHPYFGGMRDILKGAERAFKVKVRTFGYSAGG